MPSRSSRSILSRLGFVVFFFFAVAVALWASASFAPAGDFNLGFRF